MCRSLDELIKSRSVHLNRLALWTSIYKYEAAKTLFKYESCMFCISVNEWHRRAVSFTAHIHTEACDARCVFSICRLTKWGHKYMNNIPRTARRVTSWAFDRFIWVKRSSYHIYIGYRNLKGPHGNLSKYKFSLAEYITVYVIQLQQLLQLLLRIITQYAISSMF